MAEAFTGSCICQQVKYTVTGEPLSAVLCHCINCWKASGSTCLICWSKKQVRKCISTKTAACRFKFLHYPAILCNRWKRSRSHFQRHLDHKRDCNGAMLLRHVRLDALSFSVRFSGHCRGDLCDSRWSRQRMAAQDWVLLWPATPLVADNWGYWDQSRHDLNLWMLDQHASRSSSDNKHSRNDYLANH